MQGTTELFGSEWSPIYKTPEHPNKLAYGFANTFLNEEDEVYAFDQLNYPRLGSEKCEQKPEKHCRPQQPVIVPKAANHKAKDQKTAYNMVKYLKLNLTVSVGISVKMYTNIFETRSLS